MAMATTLAVLCWLPALCLAAVAPPENANAEVTSVVQSLSEEGSHHTGDNVVPLLTQFNGQEPLEETTDEVGGARQKRTFCKKCGGGFKRGRGGGYRQSYVVVPVVVQARPVYSSYRPRGGYCDPCARGGNYRPGGGGGGGSYAESFSYSRSYSSGKRK